MSFRWKPACVYGLIATGLLTGAGIWSRTSPVDQDLSQRVGAALSEQGQGWASVTVEGRDLTLQGRSFSEADRAAAIKIAENVRGVRVVADASDLYAEQSPFTLSLERKGNDVAASGFVSGLNGQAKLEGMVSSALPEAKLALNVAPARGAPGNFEALSGHSATMLKALSEGVVSVSDSEIFARGIAVSSEAYKNFAAMAQSGLPQGASLGALDIQPPILSPYRWSATRDGEAVRVAGAVPGIAQGDSLRQHLSGIDGIGGVEGDFEYASGAPQWFGPAGALGAAALGDLASGSARLSDAGLVIQGVAASLDGYKRLTTDIAARADGFEIDTSGVEPPVVSPWRWSVRRDGATVSLAGLVTDEEQRGRLVAAAEALPGIEAVADQLDVAQGPPEGFEPMALQAIDHLRHFDVAEVESRDGGVTVRGTAQSVESFDAASSLSGLPNGFSITQMDVTPATAEAYRWSAEREGDEVRLSGFVPSESLRKEIGDRVSTLDEGWNVTDDSRVALGAGEGFAGRVDVAVGLLTELSAGTIAVSNGVVTVTGTAASPESYERLLQEASASVGTQGVSAPEVSPYTWSALRQNGSVILEGYAPNVEARSALGEAFSAAIGGGDVKNRLKIAGGAPEDFAQRGEALAEILADLPEGKATFDGTTYNVAGRAVSDDSFTALRARLADLGASVDGNGLTPPPPPAVYPFEAKRSGDSVVLSGLAPDRAARKAIGESISDGLGGVDVINRLVPRSGAPDYFGTVPAIATRLLAELDSGSVRIVDGKVELVGTAKSAVSHKTLIDARNSAPAEGMAWGQLSVQPPVVAPYSWSATETGKDVVLSGFTPDRAIAGRLAERANAVSGGAVTVEDKQLQASGAPTGFEEAAGAMIDALDQLDLGTVSMTGSRVVIEGRASSEEAAQQLSEALRDALPDGFRTSSRLSWPVGAAEPVKIALPKREPAASAAEAEDAVPAADDEAGGAEATEPVTEVADTTPSVDNPSPDRQPGPTVQSVEDAEAAGCRLDFVALFDGQQIQFSSNRAVVRRASQPLLTRIAEAVKACPEEARFRIEGHTDSRGGDAFNMQLSIARAQAVLDQLVRLGVPADKMTAKGFGETLPAAPNNSAAGRAANRRIEVRVVR